MRNDLAIRVTLALTLLLTLSSIATAATWLVVAAERSVLKAGDVLDTSKTVTLKEGEKLTLLAENGKTLKLTGPYSGDPLNENTGGSQKNNDLQVIASLLQGHQQKSTVLGVVRGDLMSPPAANLINVDSSGPRCLSSDSVVLWRANALDPEQLTVADEQGKVVTSLPWPAGQSQLSIGAFPIEDGQRYRIQRDYQSVILQIFKAPVTADNRTALIAWMVRNECKEQAMNLLKGL